MGVKGRILTMFGSSYAAPAVILAVLAVSAVPIALALDDDGTDYGLVSIEGTVIEFGCCDDENDCLNDSRAGSFLLETDNGTEVNVEFGPWWYWDWVDENNGTTVRDVVAVGDRVNVTGELEEDEDGTLSLSAWKIVNIDTGEEITIKEEACPPWAGGPKELGIVDWPPSQHE